MSQFDNIIHTNFSLKRAYMGHFHETVGFKLSLKKRVMKLN